MYPKIILFDGQCNLCNAAVQFIIKRDKKDHFRFASLQSEFGQKTLSRLHLSTAEFDSFILLEGDSVFQKSEAVLKLLNSFSFPWRLMKVFWLVPQSIRNYIYDKVASNRYRLFGKRNQCMVPSPELQEKFL